MKTQSKYSSSLLIDHRTDGQRSGEGSLAVLSNGDLLLHYSRFSSGGADHDAATISALRSRDGGRSWSSPETVFQTPSEALNCMSASLLRLSDGRLGSVFCIKHSLNRVTPMWATSRDEGETWSEPQAIVESDGYFVVVNDRLVELADGTLVVPYALHENIADPEQYLQWDPAWNGKCGLFFSQDKGVTWLRSPHTITHTPELFHPPLRCGPKTEAMRDEFDRKLGVFQEPGVVQLADGRLMMHVRSAYFIYRAFASDVDAPWTDCEPMRDLNVCMGPQTIRRAPGLETLLMLYNDRGDLAFGTEEFGERTPLSVATSEDGGLRWRHRGELEGSQANYCYCSLMFSGEKFYTTYYESAPLKRKHRIGRRNLASLKYGSGLWRKWLQDV